MGDHPILNSSRSQQSREWYRDSEISEDFRDVFAEVLFGLEDFLAYDGYHKKSHNRPSCTDGLGVVSIDSDATHARGSQCGDT